MVTAPAASRSSAPTGARLVMATETERPYAPHPERGVARLPDRDRRRCRADSQARVVVSSFSHSSNACLLAPIGPGAADWGHLVKYLKSRAIERALWPKQIDPPEPVEQALDHREIESAINQCAGLATALSTPTSAISVSVDFFTLRQPVASCRP